MYALPVIYSGSVINGVAAYYNMYLLQVDVLGKCLLQSSLHLPVDLIEGVFSASSSQEPHGGHLVSNTPTLGGVAWGEKIIMPCSYIYISHKLFCIMFQAEMNLTLENTMCYVGHENVHHLFCGKGLVLVG